MGGLLASLGHLWGRSKPARSGRDDRRSAVRHPAVENEARLSWWVESECVERACRIQNIGLLGASIAVAEHPPGDHPLWLRLNAPIQTGWIEASLAWVLGPEFGVAFPGACPYDVFQALVPGCSPDGRPRPEAAPEFDSRYWR